MYLKSLEIESVNNKIREIIFHNGINLIVDDTPSGNNKIQTGNNVGKTTVLKLIDVCFGANPNIVYKDTEDKNKTYIAVKNFLIDNKVAVTLRLGNSFDDSKNDISICRNFLAGKKSIRSVNGKDILDKDYESALLKLFFPEITYNKPTFRQIISHYNRYSDEKISNTLKTLNKFTKDTEYETLYLFLLGCNVSEGEYRQRLIEQIKQEANYKKRLENGMSLSAYKSFLRKNTSDIEELNKKKEEFGINADFEEDLDSLDEIRRRINAVSSEISSLNIRKSLIEETTNGLENEKSDIDIHQLKSLYNEVTINLSEVSKNFEDLVSYHNKMIYEKIKFISAELPELNSNLSKKENELKELLKKESEYSLKIEKHDSFSSLEDIIKELNEAHRKQGELETIVNQLSSVENKLNQYSQELSTISEDLFSNNFKNNLDVRIERFNKLFSSVSKELYGESYLLTVDTKDSKGKKIYKFSSYNMNLSSGKKQGEILCFDIAYILYARQENIPHFDFLLNDKKELLHGNQLEKVADFVKKNNIQLVLTILKDKLPSSLVNDDNIILELSQNEKLFRIGNTFS